MNFKLANDLRNEDFALRSHRLKLNVKIAVDLFREKCKTTGFLLIAKTLSLIHRESQMLRSLSWPLWFGRD